MKAGRVRGLAGAIRTFESAGGIILPYFFLRLRHSARASFS
jgi:hypothetical protein